jgi:hypothetical protein
VREQAAAVGHDRAEQRQDDKNDVVVELVMSTSPGSMRPNSLVPRMTRAVPSYAPGLTPRPRTLRASFGAGAPRRSPVPYRPSPSAHFQRFRRRQAVELRASGAQSEGTNASNGAILATRQLLLSC